MLPLRRFPVTHSRCSRRGSVELTTAISLKLNQAAAGSIRHRFGSANDVKFRENAFHVRLHRALTNKERRSDLLVAFALGHQLQHVDFAVAQCFAADALREFGGEMDWHACFTRVHSTNAI